MVLQAIICWGLAWKGHHVVFHMDNTAIVASIGSGTSQNHQVVNVLRMIIMLAVQLGFFYSCSWVSSSNNQIADTASHFEYAHLVALTPSMQKKHCATHTHLSPRVTFFLWHGLATLTRTTYRTGQKSFGEFIVL